MVNELSVKMLTLSKPLHFLLFYKYYLQHERPCCIGYTNSSRRREFVYLIQHGRELVVVGVIHLCIYLFCRIELAFNIAFNMPKRKDALFVWLLWKFLQNLNVLVVGLIAFMNSIFKNALCFSLSWPFVFYVSWTELMMVSPN